MHAAYGLWDSTIATAIIWFLLLDVDGVAYQAVVAAAAFQLQQDEPAGCSLLRPARLGIVTTGIDFLVSSIWSWL